MLELIKSHAILSAVAGVVILLLAGLVVISQTKKVSPLAWNWFGPVNASSGVAIGGYDPVSYHAAGPPALGDAEHKLDWGGAEWRFASAENLDLFRADPKKMRRNMEASAPLRPARALPPRAIRRSGMSKMARSIYSPMRAQERIGSRISIAAP